VLFNSVKFVVFFPAVVFLYFALPHRFRWALLLAASYYFYMCWKAEYLVLIIISTAIDYFAALVIAQTSRKLYRRLLLACSLAGNFGLLFAFKYFNFVNDSLRAALNHFNIMYDVPALHVLLPVGISFYTFQTVSYTIDVYLGKQQPERHLGIFALYVSFFPQLVAGPIERPQRLLPQFFEKHSWNKALAIDGLQLMLWGFFKKIVIADRLAIYVNEVFNHPGAYHGFPVWLAAYFFSIQIYCDFSGYSDIAVGSAQIMGFRLIENFHQPYFSQNIAEFWRRWHVSLSTWFRDYVFIPLGGSRTTPLRRMRNIMITFLVSGLWHGANWTFVIWGGLHGLYYVFSQLTQNIREIFVKRTGLVHLPTLHRLAQIIITFHLVTFAYIFFRANGLRDAAVLVQNLAHFGFTKQAVRVIMTPRDFTAVWVFVIAMLIVEWLWQTQKSGSGRSPFAGRGNRFQWVFYYLVTVCIFIFGKFGSNPFIYFQF